MFLHVCEAHHIEGFLVELLFNNGRKGVADLSSALQGPMFDPLRDPSVFSQLRVDQELATVVWPNGADLAPEFLYFQAFKDDPRLRDQFEQWGYIV